jgi:hypothetical protein
MNKPHIGAYYFPNYHKIEQYEELHGKGWSEWEVVKCARPRFEGHMQPKKPLWGYEDESDPAVMEKKISAAAEHGIDSFIFDWYYYEDGPLRQRPLEEAFMKASNNDKLKFSIMWANHDRMNMHPAPYYCPKSSLASGEISRKAFEKMTDYVVNTYFKHPSYWKIKGCPYFSIYELYKLIQGLGSSDETASALLAFRNKTKDAGFPDLHLNAVVWGVKILPSETLIDNHAKLLDELKFESVSSYAWTHHAELKDFPVSSYEEAMQKNIDFWNNAQREYGKPYFPNVTMGWDTSPRTVQSDIFENIGYPFMPGLDSTPEKFKAALGKAMEFLSSKPEDERILSINAWNEWTEGSYLEPDEANGYAYLEAIKEVFGNN